ncbi:MAG TPA: DUF4446 family protein [Segeticoccus sp.]|nr:DUF4446 family protein [Segeticoccus sp.]
MHLSPAVTATIAVVACAVALVALLLAVTAHVRLLRLRSSFRVLWGDGRTDVATLAARQHQRLGSLRGEVDRLRGRVESVADDSAQSLRNVAVVRYDAFGDMGGRLSFSAAVLDDRGDGLVISSIHGRGESRTYAKGVVDGAAPPPDGSAGGVTLTPEEQQALAAARTGKDL